MKCPNCGAGIALKSKNMKLITVKTTGDISPPSPVSMGTVYGGYYDSRPFVPTVNKREMSVKCEHCGGWHLLSEVRTHPDKDEE